MAPPVTHITRSIAGLPDIMIPSKISQPIPDTWKMVHYSDNTY